MSDDELIAAFENQSLTTAQWTHRTHVQVAVTYIRQFGFAIALSKMRQGIPLLNARHGIIETPTVGYNETMTCAFMTLIAATLANYESALPTTTSDSFCDTHPQLMTRALIRMYYSADLRRDPRSKHNFLEPDIAPLPKILSKMDQR